MPSDSDSIPLESWTSLHPAALAAARGALELGPAGEVAGERRRDLAAALAAANRSWGNPVEGPLERWLAGADAVVTGQQPGLAGGPLLTLVKACAVAAEVRRRREAGRQAVGFLWLATADDDLPEMGWARLAAGEEVVAYGEPEWGRGDKLGGRARLGDGLGTFLASVADRFPSDNGREAMELARSCFAPGACLGDATARFLARLLVGAEIVIVDSLEPELARAGADLIGRALEELPALWDALREGGEAMTARGWSSPLRISPGTLPLFRRVGDRREHVATAGGACPDQIRRDHERDPEGFVPNAWLRPLVQDVALGTAVAVLGGAELAYHLQTAPAREVLGFGRPEWRLRPHVTVVTAAERRLAAQLGVGPEAVLSRARPRHTLPGGGIRRRTASLRRALARHLADLEGAQRDEVTALAGDLEATRRKLDGALDWWEQRLDAAARTANDTEARRWARLQAFVRPEGRPQERHLSVLAAIVKLGVDWPARLAEAIDPAAPGMHLMFWREGGAW